jgi:energy-coupling factor transporter ATP-binding protein EcfA2
MEYIATTLGNFRFDFPRITVILGANGSGKSTLLRAIKDKLPCVYVEGGRTISINDVIQLTPQIASECEDHDPTLVRYKTKRKEKLVDRILDAILVLVEREQAIREAHADAVAKWEAAGKPGDSPPYEQPPLEKLFEQYAEVFPHIHLSYNHSNGRVTVTNDYAPLPYGPSELSDGEKQVFSLMADMLELEDEYSVVVVDEPELNLHPELAERLWALLESEYPSNHFIYATHSMQFALRPSVDALYVISSDPTKIRKISNPSEIPRNELERFLAGFPGMLHGGSVIVTEGHEKSFDSLFYRWVLNDGKTEVFPCGNGSDVKQVIDKQGLWGQVSKDIRLTGVIDADHRSDQEMRQYSGPYLIPLSLHEAESYLCLPEVLVAAAHKIGSQESRI